MCPWLGGAHASARIPLAVSLSARTNCHFVTWRNSKFCAPGLTSRFGPDVQKNLSDCAWRNYGFAQLGSDFPHQVRQSGKTRTESTRDRTEMNTAAGPLPIALPRQSGKDWATAARAPKCKSSILARISHCAINGVDGRLRWTSLCELRQTDRLTGRVVRARKHCRVR